MLIRVLQISNMEKERLITPSYCCILAANFLLYFGFWLLTPVLPFYLSEIFEASNTTIGIVLSCYTISSLCIRPFSGYFLDTFARKPLYLIAYFIFICRIYGSWLADIIHYFSCDTRYIIRYGYSWRKYGSNRHYAFQSSRRRFRILWTGKQSGYVHRTDVRIVPS